MLFQKNAKVDTEVAIKLAHDFAEHAREKHGNAWKLLCLDCLSVHCNAEVKRVYSEGKVFLCYYPAQTSESTQAIDLGLGKAAHEEVRNALDNWLMGEENMLKWEGKMTASKRSVLINHLVAEATENATNKDEMRANCFVRTGSLLHWTKSEVDDSIKP